MTGKWGVYRHGERWRRARRRAWLVIRTGEHEVVQFDGPVLELTTDSRTRFDQRIAGLGPDVLAAEFDEAKFLSRVRDDDQTRGVGDALLDQRNLAGIGNIWTAETCFLAELDPVGTDGPGRRRAAAGPGTRHPAADGRVGGARRQHHHVPGRPARRDLGLRGRRAAVPALRDDRAGARAGRQQPHHVLVPRLPDLGLLRNWASSGR